MVFTTSRFLNNLKSVSPQKICFFSQQLESRLFNSSGATRHADQHRSVSWSSQQRQQPENLDMETISPGRLCSLTRGHGLVDRASTKKQTKKNNQTNRRAKAGTTKQLRWFIFSQMRETEVKLTKERTKQTGYVRSKGAVTFLGLIDTEQLYMYMHIRVFYGSNGFSQIKDMKTSPDLLHQPLHFRLIQCSCFVSVLCFAGNDHRWLTVLISLSIGTITLGCYMMDCHGPQSRAWIQMTFVTPPLSPPSTTSNRSKCVKSLIINYTNFTTIWYKWFPVGPSHRGRLHLSLIWGLFSVRKELEHVSVDVRLVIICSLNTSDRMKPVAFDNLFLWSDSTKGIVSLSKL